MRASCVNILTGVRRSVATTTTTQLLLWWWWSFQLFRPLGPSTHPHTRTGQGHNRTESSADSLSLSLTQRSRRNGAGQTASASAHRVRLRGRSHIRSWQPSTCRRSGQAKRGMSAEVGLALFDCYRMLRARAAVAVRVVSGGVNVL
jgi:hypothetical protein